MTIEIPGASTDAALAEYKARLACADWSCEFSDDYSVTRAGNAEIAALTAMRKEVDADGAIWNSIVPSGRKLVSV